MCNCGNKRNELAVNGSVRLSGSIAGAAAQPKMWKDVNFKYTGSTGITITGAVTGKRYRFALTGDVQMIDYRDVSGMLSVPLLKRQ